MCVYRRNSTLWELSSLNSLVNRYMFVRRTLVRANIIAASTYCPLNHPAGTHTRAPELFWQTIPPVRLYICTTPSPSVLQPYQLTSNQACIVPDHLSLSIRSLLLFTTKWTSFCEKVVRKWKISSSRPYLLSFLYNPSLYFPRFRSSTLGTLLVHDDSIPILTW